MGWFIWIMIWNVFILALRLLCIFTWTLDDRGMCIFCASISAFLFNFLLKLQKVGRIKTSHRKKSNNPHLVGSKFVEIFHKFATNYQNGYLSIVTHRFIWSMMKRLPFWLNPFGPVHPIVVTRGLASTSHSRTSRSPKFVSILKW